jgi:hypothetical protein
MYKHGQADVHNEEQSGQPSVVSNDLQNVDKRICERQHFTIPELLYEFPKMSCTVLYEIIIVRLGYHKFCLRQVPKTFMGA